MDELEACVWLTHEHGSRVLADTSSDNQHVLVAGGARGLLRFFKVEYAYSSGKKGFANGVGVELTCTPLLALAVTGTSALPSVLFSAGLNSNNNKLSTSLSSGSGDMDRPLDGLQAISHILYPGGKLGGFDDCESAPLVAVTDDQVMVSYSILPYSGETEETKSKSKGSKGNKDKGNNKGKGSQSQQPESQSGSLVRRRQLVGAHDDILDVACVPMKRVKGQRKRYQLAVATNGPHVRLTSLSARSAGAGEGGDTEDLLYGHTDTVLSLNGSPDGYVNVNYMKLVTSFFVFLVVLSCLVISIESYILLSLLFIIITIIVMYLYDILCNAVFEAGAVTAYTILLCNVAMIASVNKAATVPLVMQRLGVALEGLKWSKVS
jgi:hypothetical protein